MYIWREISFGLHSHSKFFDWVGGNKCFVFRAGNAVYGCSAELNTIAITP